MSSLIRPGACALVVGALAVAAGCGGGGGSPQPAAQKVRGSHFLFEAPFAWHVRRTKVQVSVSPRPIAPELVSVSVFPLLHPYRPALLAAVSRELDGTAQQLATRLHGSVESSKTLVVAGGRSRQYELRYSTDGHDYRQLITFVLRGKTEYQLLCRWEASKSEPSACGQLETTFTPL